MYDGHITTTDPGLVSTLDDLPEGYKGYVRVDEDAHNDSPRSWHPNTAVLIQCNDRRGDADECDDYGLAEARERWYNGKGIDSPMIQRYVAMFRPDIAYYCDYWSAGRDLYGWGYVTRAALAEAGYSSDAEVLNGTLKMRARTLFDQEVDIYQQWADGEVYGITVVHEESGEEADLWGVYDTPGYFAEVAAELIAEIEAR